MSKKTPKCAQKLDYKHVVFAQCSKKASKCTSLKKEEVFYRFFEEFREFFKNSIRNSLFFGEKYTKTLDFSLNQTKQTRNNKHQQVAPHLILF